MSTARRKATYPPCVLFSPSSKNLPGQVLVETSAIVCIEAGELTVEQVEAEFKDLVEEEWDWQVQKVSETDFSLVFPSKESLAMAIRGGGIKLPSSQCHALVMSNTADPAAVEQLVETKVKLFGVPPPFRYRDRLLVGARELGSPLVVDETSLSNVDGPIRMTVGYWAPVQLPESIMLFVNLQGFRVRVFREGVATVTGPLSPPPPHKTADDKEEEDVADSDGDRWDGLRGRHARKEPQSKAPKNHGKQIGTNRKSVPLAPPNLSVHGQGTDTVRAAKDSVLSALSEEEKKEIGWQSLSPAAREKENLRAKERSSKSNNDRPSKVCNPDLAAVATHLEFSDDNVAASKMVGEQLQGGQVIPELAVTVARAPKSRASPVEASRKSARGLGLTEGPVLERAMLAAADKEPTVDAPRKGTRQSKPAENDKATKTYTRRNGGK
ncbi:hypothetical protein QYE76_038417 [Lolium multiflorum]|uniref:Uncharacterized protein n=1 Tax=Lolium multiflorum TaxID=4521 RepID=A0AAD8WR79_LOLMU|nr:hypothetical protein QYE76_038417 [Lolium multiflorum]